MPKKSQIFIGVVGAGECSAKMKKTAEKVGRAIADNGGILVCGGLGGVMEGAAKGAKDGGGVTIGILPGKDKAHANQFIEYPIVTGLGEARNLLVVRNSDVVIALPGKYGTLSEMAFCLKIGKPLVSLSAWDISDDIERFNDPVLAVEQAFKLAGK